MDTSYQKIFNLMVDHLPENWEKFSMYFATVDNMMDFKYYIDVGNGYIDCFNQENYNKKDFIKLTFSIDEILSAEKNALPKKKRWTVFTMHVSSTGKFKVDYFYDDISKNFIEYREKWEKDYIVNK